MANKKQLYSLIPVYEKRLKTDISHALAFSLAHEIK